MASKAKRSNSDLSSKKELGYLDSTQFKHWIFPSTDIVDEKRLESLRKQISFLQSSNWKSHCNAFPAIPTDEEYLSSLRYYCKEIVEICRKFRFPPYVACTAVTYFKRFFLNPKYNLINTDAMCMKDTAIYMASKTEQSLFSGVDQLTAFTKIPSHQVINNELVLLDGISFHLKVWSPFRCFRSFVNDFKVLYKKERGEKALDSRVEQQIVDQGHALLQDAYISDVCLVYTPSQMALSCMLLVAGNITLDFSGKDYFEKRFASNADVDKLRETVTEIQRVVIEAINRCSPQNEKYKKLQKEANTKIYKLQNLYYSIKNKADSVTVPTQEKNVKKKRTLKLKMSAKKRKVSNPKAPPPPKRQKR